MDLESVIYKNSVKVWHVGVSFSVLCVKEKKKNLFLT